ncbi:von Willebrand factor A domain-containing protein 7 isoform X2 [Protopterus annectens]|nr:von Willebrand factor A domain-containing protein 7 isoform X2 [Protopterus annectens]
MEHSLVLWSLFVCIIMTHNATCFFPNFWSKLISGAWRSSTHQDITEEAILRVTLQAFQEVPNSQGQKIDPEEFKGKILVSDDIFAAYYGMRVSTKKYRLAISEVVNANAAMDFLNTTRNDAIQHFDSEQIQAANQLLLFRRKEVIQAIKSENYEVARTKLGELLHSLQDFYSHTNWVEMGYLKVHPHLLLPGKEVKAVVGESEPTCRDCDGMECWDNVLEIINKKKLLTSGYYGSQPEKPPGKCSHGGIFDDSRNQGAKGGINKDSTSSLFSPHYYLHAEAAELAERATVKFLQELREAVSNKLFMRLFNIGSGAGLSFVIDTTGSMFEEIQAAKERAHDIIEKRHGTLDEPEYYLLVPFHDPDFGPVTKTRDPEEFFRKLSDLYAIGGGDEPEMCFSAIQMALLNSPPLSDIFVFTDASAKDMHLKNTLESLLHERRSRVTFLLTEDPLRKGRGRREVLHPDRFQPYESIAEASGGQVVFTSNEGIQQVSTIIEDVTASSMVTLYQKLGHLHGKRIHHFYVDNIVENITVQVAGQVTSVVILDPADRVQYQDILDAQIQPQRSAGSFFRTQLPPQTAAGRWSIELHTLGKYTVHVRGHSQLDFLYHFAVPSHGTHPGLSKIDGKPMRGVPTTLVLSVTGIPHDSAALIEEVSLQGVHGESLATLSLEPTNHSGEFVVEVPSLPDQAFSVLLRGKDEEGNILQRVSTELNSIAEVMVEVSTPNPLYPNQNCTLFFLITNLGMKDNYKIHVTDDQSFLQHVNISRAHLNTNESVKGEIILLPPAHIKTGSVVTVTLVVESAKTKNFNFAVKQLSVADQKWDSDPPVCSAIQMNQKCTSLASKCQWDTWTVSFHILEVGSGIARVLQKNGNASITFTESNGIAVALFTSDCCSLQAELYIEDKAGNLGNCHFSTSPTSRSTRIFMWKITILALQMILYIL